MSSHPYKNLEHLSAWKVLDRALTELVENGDLKELTARRYILGYIIKQLSGAAALRANGQSERKADKQVSSNGFRFRPDALHHHRVKLGLSAKDYGKLIGVSGLTIHHWEAGKVKPRRKWLPNIAAVLRSN